MPPNARHAALVAVAVLAAGCITGAPGSSTPGAPTTDGDAGWTATAGQVEYVLQAGTVPDTFARADATVQLVLVENPADLGPCYRAVHTGPYKPTITPIRTPRGPCHRPATVTVDLASLEGNRTVGPVSVDSGVEGHALVLTDLEVTDENGRRVAEVRYVGGAELHAVADRSTGRVEVTLSIHEAPAERPYDYRLSWDTDE